MLRPLRRATPVAVVSLVLIAALAGAARASVTPDPTLPIDFVVKAKTHVARLNKDIDVPPGRFVGTLDLATGNLVGDLKLPPAQTTVSVAGLRAATAGFAVAPVGHTTGHVDLATFRITATSVFTVRIPFVYPLGVPVNVVGSACQTTQPISITFSGKIDLAGSRFSSAYSIPDFRSCQLATPAINLLVPGPGNTFTATFSPPPPTGR